MFEQKERSSHINVSDSGSHDLIKKSATDNSIRLESNENICRMTPQQNYLQLFTKRVLFQSLPFHKRSIGLREPTFNQKKNNLSRLISWIIYSHMSAPARRNADEESSRKELNEEIENTPLSKEVKGRSTANYGRCLAEEKRSGQRQIINYCNQPQSERDTKMITLCNNNKNNLTQPKNTEAYREFKTEIKELQKLSTEASTNPRQSFISTENSVLEKFMKKPAKPTSSILGERAKHQEDKNRSLIVMPSGQMTQKQKRQEQKIKQSRSSLISTDQSIVERYMRKPERPSSSILETKTEKQEVKKTVSLINQTSKSIIEPSEDRQNEQVRSQQIEKQQIKSTRSQIPIIEKQAQEHQNIKPPLSTQKDPLAYKKLLNNCMNEILSLLSECKRQLPYLSIDINSELESSFEDIWMMNIIDHASQENLELIQLQKLGNLRFIVKKIIEKHSKRKQFQCQRQEYANYMANMIHLQAYAQHIKNGDQQEGIELQNQNESISSTIVQNGEREIEQVQEVEVRNRRSSQESQNIDQGESSQLSRLTEDPTERRIRLFDYEDTRAE